MSSVRLLQEQLAAEKVGLAEPVQCLVLSSFLVQVGAVKVDMDTLSKAEEAFLNATKVTGRQYLTFLGVLADEVLTTEAAKRGYAEHLRACIADLRPPEPAVKPQGQTLEILLPVLQDQYKTAEFSLQHRQMFATTAPQGHVMSSWRIQHPADVGSFFAVELVNAESGPVLVAYHRRASDNRIIEAAKPPTYDITQVFRFEGNAAQGCGPAALKLFPC